MSRKELIQVVSDKTNFTKKDTEALIKASEETIIETLTNREKVTLTGFGTFDTADRAERLGRNPKTQEEITIAASVAPKFNAGKTLKDAVNGR